MQIPDKTTGDTLTGAEFTELKNEVKNSIEKSGLTSTTGSTQLQQAIARSSSRGNVYADSGAADAYVLTAVGSQEQPSALLDGLTVIFEAGNTNTGASTVNVAGLGAKSIKKNGYADDVTAGDITAGLKYFLIYDSSEDAWELGRLSYATLFDPEQVFHIQHQEASGVDGGNTVATTWTKRTLNTVLTNNISGASLASSVITLPAGTYELISRNGFYGDFLHKSRIRQTSGTPATLLVGSSEQQYVSSEMVTSSVARGLFTLSGSTDIELQYYASSSQTGGEGNATGSGEVEVYADVFIKKIG